MEAKIRLSLLLSAALLASCVSGRQTLLHGVTVSDGAGDHISMTDCVDDEEIARWAAVAWPLLLSEAESQGYASAEDLRRMAIGEQIKLCLIEEPQMCCLGGWPCAAPCATSGGTATCARKAGCATPGYVWASKRWPPACRPEMPDVYNTNCGDADKYYDWRATLVHELGNVVRQRLLTGEGYDARSVTSFFRHDGPVGRTYDIIRTQAGKAPQ